METGYYDVCMPLCLGQKVENRQWYACRKVSDELPKPTMARWCEHGYVAGFNAAGRALVNVFQSDSGSSDGSDSHVGDL